MPKHFENTFIGRESRKTKYTKWSERAVVVGYNSENQSYDIVVTTERLVGVNKRTLNRTIRRVKSIFPSDVDTFLPGTAVLVGYVSDKREHPVILGQGDNVVQTPVKVTLGPTLNVEGETSSELTDPENLFNTFLPLEITCELDAVPGLTCSIDCSILSPEIRFKVNGGVPPYLWTLPVEGPAGCTYGGIGGPSSGPPTPDGVNDSRLVITAPLVVGLTFPAYEERAGTGSCSSPGIQSCLGTPPPCNLFGDCCHEQGNGFALTRDCNGDFIDFGSCIINAPSGPILYIIGSPGGKQEACADALDWFLTTDVCASIRNKNVPGTLITDIRTQTTINTGCCPCELAFGGLVITVTDAIGNMVSQTVTVTNV